jgi:CheY-like chemotaxis protein
MGAGVSIRMELADEVPHVAADANRLREVLSHLLANALESIAGRGGEGEIRVRTLSARVRPDGLNPSSWELQPEPGEYGHLEIQDDGSGIDAETRSRMFDPFFSTKVTGRGLGLATVLGILRSHGGGIRVTNNEAGGTSISIYLPRHPGVERRDWIPRPTHIPPPKARGRSSPRQLRALVVDDEACVREVVARMLESAGYESIACESGTEALEVVRERGPEFSVVLLDIVMSGMSGLNVLRDMRTIAPGMPVIVFSGYPESAKDPRLLDTPNLVFLGKPFLRQDLQRALERLGLEVHSKSS